MALTAGCVFVNSSVIRSSHAHVSDVFSRSFNRTSPPGNCGVRVFTMNVRLTNSPGRVSTFSTIRRRSSALMVVTEAASRSPSVTVTR